MYISKNIIKKGKWSPEMARIDPPEIPSREGCKKGGYSLSSDGVTGLSVPSEGVPDRFTTLTGRDSQGVYNAIGPDLQDGIVTDQEELPCPFGRPNPEFPGSHVCQGDLVKARDLSLVVVQDLQNMRERCLRTFHFHKHVPVRFDDNEIERTVPFTGYLLHAPAPPASTTASLIALTGLVPGSWGVSCSRHGPLRDPQPGNRRSLSLLKISSFIRSCRSIRAAHKVAGSRLELQIRDLGIPDYRCPPGSGDGVCSLVP